MVVVLVEEIRRERVVINNKNTVSLFNNIYNILNKKFNNYKFNYLPFQLKKQKKKQIEQRSRARIGSKGVH